MSGIREPIKKSSIEKKNKIIEKGFELICEKGYHNVTCIDIAKHSGVSTGIIYQYFNDKRDIFLSGIKGYSASILYPMIDVLEKQKIDKNNIDKMLNSMIDRFVEKHTISKKAHEELIAMSCLDEEVAKIFNDFEMQMTEKVSNILKYNQFDIDNIDEKVHVIYGIMDNYCHEVVYHQHNLLNYEIMKEIIIKIIKNILLSSK